MSGLDRFWRLLDVLLDAAEMNVQLVEMLQQRAERSALRHLGKRVHILRETLTAVSELTIRTRNIRVRVIDVTRQKNTGVNLSPVCAHLLAIFAARIEIRYFIRAEHIVHVFG